MKKAIMMLLLVSFFFNSCEKENEKVAPSNKILYHVLNPSIVVSSVDSLIDHPSGCGYIPSPSDSSASITIDINDDGLMDFTLTCSSWYSFVSASNPCANYNTNITLSGTSNDNKLAITGNYNVVNLFEFNDELNSSQEWSNTGILMLSSALAPFSTNFNGDKYLGLKINQDQEDLFGWIYIDKNGYEITVISYAINQTANISIKAGQIE